MNVEKIAFYTAIIMILLIIAALIILNIETKNKNGFTELSFINDLPKTIEINKEYNFSFAIHNLENKKMAYDYVVYINSDKTKQGNVIINHDNTAILYQNFIVKKIPEDSSIPVSIQLLNKNQEIHFWVNLK